MTKLVGIFGAGGAGRGIMPLARSMGELAGAKLVFVDDGPAGQGNAAINGHSVVTFERFCALRAAQKSIALAVADTRIRKTLAERCRNADIPLQDVRSAQTIVMDEVVIGEGAIISPQVVFTSNIRIGRCFHANIASYVEHDCEIGDYVTFAPSVRCNGNIVIGDFAYVGSNAVIRQGITIGEGAVVGMGAVVTKDVPPHTTVVGNPARVLYGRQHD